MDGADDSARAALQRIADALGVPVEAFSQLPADPDRDEVRALLAAFSTLGGPARRRVLAAAEAEVRKAAGIDG